MRVICDATVKRDGAMKKLMLLSGGVVQRDCGIGLEKCWNLKGLGVWCDGWGRREVKTLSILTGVVLTAFEGSC